MSAPGESQGSFPARLARAFIDLRVTPLLVVLSLLLGAGAVAALPREEDPQIDVPMVDVTVPMPGVSADEVENRLSTPLERVLFEIAGIDYVYSTSQPGQSIVSVRFRVGEDMERSLVKVHQKLDAFLPRLPPGASPPVVKARAIDEVPVLTLTFHSSSRDLVTLRAIAARVDAEINRLIDVSATTLVGGRHRQVRVQLDPGALAAYGLGPADVARALGESNRQLREGSLMLGDQNVLVQAGAFLASADDVGETVVRVREGRPVHVRDVAQVTDSEEKSNVYVFYGSGAATSAGGPEEAAVTLLIAKNRGTSATALTEDVLADVDRMKGRSIPGDVEVTVTRDYGATGTERLNSLLSTMTVALVSVSLLMLLMLGWRESLVVAIAISTTLALTMLTVYASGYTLNRVTVYGLIFAISILVDDAILMVDDLVSLCARPGSRGLALREIAVQAVGEQGNRNLLVMATVLAAVLPMARLGGLVGPFIRPGAMASAAAGAISLLVAFVVAPWAAVRILGGRRGPPRPTVREDILMRPYRAVMRRLTARAAWRRRFFGLLAVLLLGALALVPARCMSFKMLPVDNRDEFTIVLDMPESSSLERSAQAAREIAEIVRREPEVVSYQSYVGTAAPIAFSGLVRRYYERRGPGVVDVRVNLLPREQRRAKSHDVVRRIRPAVAAAAARFGARIASEEVPPGPPVLQTLVAEVYGPDEASRRKLAEAMRDTFRGTPGVVDVSWFVKDPHPKENLVVDKEKAAIHGISPQAIIDALRPVVQGESVGLLHVRAEEDVDIVLDWPRPDRSSIDDLLLLRIPDGTGGSLVPLRQLVVPERATEQQTLFHKNLLPVVYVTGDVAGGLESVGDAVVRMNRAVAALNARDFGGSPGRVAVYNAVLPASDAQPAIKWDGEWQITIEALRSFGVALAVALVVIYAMLVTWFRSLVTPLVVMATVPITLIAILPAHAALGAPFTATSMVGFIAGAGLFMRHAVGLVDLIETGLREGTPLEQSVVEAGAARFRPLLLSSIALDVGGVIVLFDPVFEGLAISLLAGQFASLAFARVAVPLLYAMEVRRRARRPPDPPGDAAP
jgi:multidrug efflux pump subunit AcrB